MQISRSAMDEPLQLRSDILQTAAPAVVASLAALEGVANPSAQCAEWVARVFLQPAEGVDPMRNAAALAPRFDSLLCRSHVKPACAHLDARAARALRGACALVLSGSVALLDDRDGESDGGGRRIAALLAAVARELPALEGRLKFGADVTIRRSCGQHDLMTTNGKHAAGAGGAAGAAAGAAGGAAGVDAAAKGSAHGNSARQQHPDAAIHCDSFDGSILCFGLCSTKLGTPVYPEARFPSPLQVRTKLLLLVSLLVLPLLLVLTSLSCRCFWRSRDQEKTTPSSSSRSGARRRAAAPLRARGRRRRTRGAARRSWPRTWGLGVAGRRGR